MSNWVTPDGFLSSTTSLPMPTHSHAGPVFAATLYTIAAGVVGVMILAVLVYSVARHVSVALRARRRRVLVRDRAAAGAHAP